MDDKETLTRLVRRWAADVADPRSLAYQDRLVTRILAAGFGRALAPLVSRQAIGDAFRKNHQAGNRDDLGLDAIHALQLPAGNSKAVKDLLEQIRYESEQLYATEELASVATRALVLMEGRP